MDLHVCLPDGDYLHVSVPVEATVADLKRIVAVEAKYPSAAALMLDINGQDVGEADEPLKDTGLVEGDVMQLRGSVEQVSRARLLELGIMETDYDEALMAACRRGKHDAEVVSLLVSAGASVKCTCRRYQCDSTFCYHCMDDLPHEQMCAFHTAAIAGRAPIMQVLIDAGADVDSVCYAEYPPRTTLGLAAAAGNLPAVNLLIALGACPSVEGTETPLRHAHGPVLRALLSHGCDPNVMCEDNRTPLGWAAQEGRAEDVAQLLDNGALIHPVPLPPMRVGTSAAAASETSSDSLSVVSTEMSDISASSGESAESQGSCFAGFLASMCLSKAKVHPAGHPEPVRVQPVFPLAAAASTCQTRCVSLLLKRGAQIHTQPSQSPISALFRSYCNEEDVAAVLELFLDHGLCVNAPLDPLDAGRGGAVWRILHQALCYPRTKAAALLLKRGADPNLPVCYITSPRVTGTAAHLLMNKACRPQEVREAAHTLKEFGCNFTVKDSRGRLPHELGRGSCFLTCEDIAILSQTVKTRHAHARFAWLPTFGGKQAAEKTA